jgi:hypothetical protein
MRASHLLAINKRTKGDDQEGLELGATFGEKTKKGRESAGRREG